MGTYRFEFLGLIPELWAHIDAVGGNPDIAALGDLVGADLNICICLPHCACRYDWQHPHGLLRCNPQPYLSLAGSAGIITAWLGLGVLNSMQAVQTTLFQYPDASGILHFSTRHARGAQTCSFISFMINP